MIGSLIHRIRYVLAAVCLFGGTALRAQDQVEDTIKLVVGSVYKIEPRFAVERFQVGGAAVKVLDLPNGQNPISIRADKVGVGDVQLVGAGGITAKYRFTVDDVGPTVAVVRRLLEAVPSVEVTAVGNQAVIEGTVSDADQWRRLAKVCADYKGQVSNYAKFQPPDEWLVQIQQALEQRGFKVVALSEKGIPPTGTLKLGMRANSLYVSGVVYNEGDVRRIAQVLSMQDWVELPKVDKENRASIDHAKLAEEGRILAVMNVTTKPPVLVTVDIAVLAVDEAKVNAIGVNLLKNGLLDVSGGAQAFANIINGRSSSVPNAFGTSVDAKTGHGAHGGGAAGIAVGTTLQGTLQASDANTIARDVRKASIAPFLTGDPNGGMFHLGGTLKARLVAPSQTGPSAQQSGGIQDIDYGFMVKTTGELLDDKTVSLKVDFELSVPVQIGTMGDYDLKRNRSASQVVCGLDKTLVMSGNSVVTDTVTDDGVMFLKKIPVLGYLFNEKSKSKEATSVLVLISPRLAEAPRDGTIDIQDIRATEQKVAQPADTRIKEVNK